MPSSREREREKDGDEWLWTAASRTAGLLVLFFQPLKDILAVLLISWLSQDLLSSRGHTHTDCTPQHDNQTLALLFNQITFQPGSDLWSLPEHLQKEMNHTLLRWINAFISARMSWKGHGDIDDANYFWKLSKRSSVLTWLTFTHFVDCHQQRLRTADGFAKCSHSVAQPIRPICMNRLNVHSADSAVSKTVLCSFLLGLTQI